MNGSGKKRGPYKKRDKTIKVVSPLDSDEELHSELKDAMSSPRGILVKAAVVDSSDLKAEEDADETKRSVSPDLDAPELEDGDDDDADELASLFEDALEELGDEALMNGDNGK